MNNTRTIVTRGTMWERRTGRRFLVMLAVLAILFPALSSRSKVAADDSNFNMRLQDTTTGDDVFVNLATGEYLFFNAARQSFISGKGEIKADGCAVEVRDQGPNRKQSDRDVLIVFNPCDKVATASCQVAATNEQFAIVVADINQVVRADSAGAAPLYYGINPPVHAEKSRTVETNGAIISADQNFEGKPAQQAVGNDDADKKGGAPRTETRFGICIQDDTQPLFFSVSGFAYAFLDGTKKSGALRGNANWTVNGCKNIVTDDGPDPKRPDRHVYIEFNTCTNQASGFIWVAETGRTYIIQDSNTANSTCGL